jgi:hypothetical protein
MALGVFGSLLATTSCTTSSGSDGSPTTPEDSSNAIALLERLPIDLASLDFAAIVANRAGRDSDWLPLHDFGLIFPATAERPLAKANPQPTFYAPLGTPVVAIVSGVVTGTPKLYSNDSSVMIAANGGSGAPIWEMEHVIKVRVQVGDHVVAGDTIAEVSDYECKWGRNGNPGDPFCASGLGLVEIGLLYGGNPPEHRCPFEPQLVAESMRTTLFNQLDSARARIEAAFGDTTKYDKAGWATPHCVTLTRVPG